MPEQEWEHLQTFLVAAREGSFTKAAHRLGVSQPTVSRRIEELELSLGAELFIRHSRGLRLTDRGASLFGSAEGLDSQVKEAFRRVRRRTLAPEGTVRVSVNEPLGVYVLPDSFARISSQYPKIELEVIVDNGATDLTRREADLAVRMFEPKQGDLVAKKLGHVPIWFFASTSYVKRYQPQGDFDVTSFPTIGMDQDPSWPRMLRELGLSHTDFPFRTDSLILQVAAAVAGIGIVGTHPKIGKKLGLVRVFPNFALPGYDVWLVHHHGLRHDLGVRTVAKELETDLAAYLGEDETSWPESCYDVDS